MSPGSTASPISPKIISPQAIKPMMQEEPLIDIPAGHPEGYLEEDIHKTKLTQVVQPIPQGKAKTKKLFVCPFPTDQKSRKSWVGFFFIFFLNLIL